MIATYTPRVFMTLEFGAGKRLSFKARDIDEAMPMCKRHLNRLGMSYGILKDMASGEVLVIISLT